jgi:hypothetical protein
MHSHCGVQRIATFSQSGCIYGALVMDIFSNKLRFGARGLTAATELLGCSAALAQTAATIPAGLQGTYSLTYTNAQPGSPLTEGTAVTMVLVPGGTVCIADYVLANPQIENGNPAEAFWGVPALGLRLAMSNISTGTFNEVNVLSTSNQFYGQFKGNKTSNATSCGLLGGTPQNISTIAGTVSTSGVSVPFSITIDSIPAPGSSDINSLEDDVRKAFDNVENVNASTFTNFQISEVSASDSRVFFRARFSATSTTATPIGPLTTSVSYNLTYEYLKK